MRIESWGFLRDRIGLIHMHDKCETNTASVLSVPSLKQVQPATPLLLSFRRQLIVHYTFLNKRVRYAIQSATTMYPIIVMKLAIVEATNGS